MIVTNPATGEPIGEVAVDDEASVAAAFGAAADAQPAWAARPLKDRIACVGRFERLVEARRDELAQILTAEVGKPISQSGAELDGLRTRLDFFADAAERVLGERCVLDQPDAGLREVVAREPLGVVANVSAWNYPWFVGGNVWAPALLAGNAVLYKPSEFAPLTGRAVADLWHEAGVPAAVFAVLQGKAAVGGAVIEQAVGGVYFTGSNATGRRIAAASAGRLRHLQLELGGKDPAYVCDDVDVEAAAASLADGAFYNTGQSCCSVERIYVHESVYDDFVDCLVANVDAFRVGPPSDPETYIGPLTRAAGLELIEGQVVDALARGATLRIGGHRLAQPGHWFAPTVLTGADHTMAVMREETFGPVVAVQAVESDSEAASLANDTRYGLTAAVYTPDETRARAWLSQVRSGTAYWNCCDRVSPRLPWSGRGDSGVGVTLGDEGIAAFTQPRSWHLKQG